MKKKYLFRNIFKKIFKLKKKSKKKLEKVEVKKIPKEKFSKLKLFYKKYRNHLILRYADKFDSFKKFIFIVVGYGLILNLPLYFIFGFNHFNIGTVLSFGIIYYFIKDELIEWFRTFVSIIKEKQRVR